MEKQIMAQTFLGTILYSSLDATHALAFIVGIAIGILGVYLAR